MENCEQVPGKEQGELSTVSRERTGRTVNKRQGRNKENCE
jgi:hypothetical protein